MTPTTLYLVRHGETDFNRRGIVQGKGVNAPLNETGRMQAVSLASALKPVRFGAIYASTLLRARQTAEIVAEMQGFEDEITHRDGLNEISWGVLEGQPVTGRNTGATPRGANSLGIQEFRLRTGGRRVSRGGGKARRTCSI